MSKKKRKEESILIRASRMAKAGGYGFMGTSGMRSYKERLQIALRRLRGNTGAKKRQENSDE